ncbi:MAG TPA: flagellar basal body rod protein FlgC [Acidobacteriaceae bacterium]|nr:flagellar basal body rod protein FlgC [Acidobacteriaceae bacterium]
MNLFGVMDVSASALEAERLRAEVVASNMANANTTRTPQGGPYKRQQVVFESQASDQGAFANHFLSQGAGFSNNGLENNDPEGRGDIGGVKIAAVVSDNSPGVRRYDPGHPDADKNGYVTFPDINPLTEMVDLMSATRAYDLNSSAVEATKGMITSSLDILK